MCIKNLKTKQLRFAKKQKQRLTAKKLAACFRGGLARRNDRIERTKIIYETSEKKVAKISKRELWLIGTALYWAEGSKEKENRPGSGVNFTNSDYEMVQIFICWLKWCCGIGSDQIGYEIYIHENCRDKIQQVIKFWSEKINVSESYLQTIRYKKNKINTRRKNVGDLYNGCLRVKVRASSTLNRKIVVWIGGIMKNLK